MTTFSFSSEAGNTITFNPLTDVLQFSGGYTAANLQFEQIENDLKVINTNQFVVLAAVVFSNLIDTNFLFDNGSVVRLDTNGADTLVGSNQADFFSIAMGGGDTVTAGDGDDRIYAGSALDTGDQISGGAGSADHLVLSGTTNVALGANTVTGVEAIVALAGSDVNLTLHADTVASVGTLIYDGSAQTQSDSTVLDASAVTTGTVSLTGGAGDDTLTGGANADTIVGGAGTDTINGEGGDDVITGGQDGDTLTGGTGDDRFAFGFGIPRSESSPATAATIDTITDFEGRGAAGGDLIDLPSFSGSLPLAFNTTAISFTHLPFGGAGTQLPAELIGDGFADVAWQFNAAENRNEIWVDANDDGQFSDLDMLIFLSWTSGSSAISITDFVDNFPVIRLTTANDTFTANDLANMIYALAGEDTVSGAGGADIIYGGGDDDTLNGGTENDQLFGDAANDTLNGDGGSDQLFGGAGDDTLSGGTEADALYAGIGVGSGDAVNAVNALNGDAGNDQLYGAEGLDTLHGGADDDFLNGYGSDDALFGDDGNDALHGADGDDTLDGGAGDDTLQGYLGHDVLTGGADADTFQIFSGHSSLALSNRDQITAFDSTEGDRLDIGSIGSGTFAGRPAVFRGEIVGFPESPVGGEALGGADIGAGFTQIWWARVGIGPATKTFLIADLDDDRELSGDDYVVEFTGTSFGNQTEAPTAAMFASDSFRAFVGTQGDDIPIDGSSGDDQIYGLGGNDTLNGLAGNDQLQGGLGNDILNGGADNDSLLGEGGDDTLNGDAGFDTLDGGAGIDTLHGGTEGDNLSGGDGDDTLNGGSGNDSLSGGADNDVLNGEDGDDGLIGNVGNDTLSGGDGNDFLYAASSSFFNSSGDASNSVNSLDGGAGNDFLFGAEGQDALTGGADNDNILGGDNNDTLEGDAGTDVLSGDGGQDTLTGGTEADTFQWYSALHSDFSAPDQVTDFNASDGDLIDLGALNGNWNSLPVVFRGELPGGFVYSSGSALGGDDLGTGFSQLFWARVAGGTKTALIGDTNDNRQLDSTDFVVEFTGASFGGQTESLTIADFVANTFKVVVGTPGNDTLNGTPDDDRIYGVAGNDTIDGLAGTDEIHGGAGDDTLTGGTEGDMLYGDADNDTLTGDGGGDQLFGGAGNDTLHGGADGDTIHGEDGDDTLNGDSGDDFLVGGTGSDILNGHDGSDFLAAGPSISGLFSFGDATDTVNTLDGGSGNDTLLGAEGQDTLIGGADTDYMTAGDGDDTLQGDGGDDTLIGGAGNDNLDGGAGIDVLAGGTGQDTLTGGTEADVFQLDNQQSPFGAPDQVTDFTAAEGDKIQLTFSFSPGPLVFHSDELTDFVYAAGSALPGDELGTGFTQIFWTRVGTGPSTKTLIIGDMNENRQLDSSDFVAEFTGSSFSNQTEAVTIAHFVPDQFTVIVGTAGNDDLDGTPNADQIYGVGGNDTIDGFAGSDALRGGSGDDTINGGDDADTLHGEADNDTLNGEAGSDTLIGGAGDDVLQAGNDDDTLYAANASFLGSFGDATTAVNTLDGGSGSDTLFGAEGQDALIGGADNDYLDGSDGNDALQGNDGQDQLIGGSGNDVLDGGAGTDTLRGNAGQDTYTGGTEADQFQLSNSFETSFAAPDQVTDFSPGDGDQIVVSAEFNRPAVFRGELVGFNYALGATLPGNDYGTGFTQYWWARVGTGLDTKTLLISDTNDNFLLDNSDFVVEFTGFSFGSHTLDPTAADFAAGTFVVTVGTPADDLMNGDATNNRLYGVGGADTINGLEGNDQLFGGLGNDTVSGGDDDDDVRGEAGNDTVHGDAGNDFVSGGAGDDVISGGDGGDFLYAADIGFFGSSGDATTAVNTLNGGFGNDFLFGAEGRDTLNGGLDDDQLSGGANDDILNGDSGVDVLDGGNGDDILSGGSLGDQLNGGDGNDMADYSSSTGVTVSLDGTLTATGHAEGDSFTSIENLTGSLNDPDTLRGDGNDNILRGQGGADTLDGAGGQDTADYSNSTGVTVSLDGSLTATGDADGDIFIDVENLTGSATGPDTLKGDGNANVLAGLGGDDTLTLGGGADTVVYRDDDGADTVTDFSLLDGDKIDLTGVEGASILAGVMSFATQDGADTLFDGGGGNTLRLQGVDMNLLNDEQYFILAVNQIPTDIALTSGTVAENVLAGTVVGTLSASDIDFGETFTFSLSSNPGGYFSINGNELVANDLLDFELTPSIQIVVRATDSANNTFDEQFTINVNNVNEDPTDIELSGTATLAENSANGTVVGMLSATDPDAGETFGFSLIDDAGGRFGISGTDLVVTGPLDYEQATSYDVTVRVTDSGNNTRDELFTVSLTNVGGVTITGTAGNDMVNASMTVSGQPLPTDEEDTINGANGNDVIEALGGNDTVTGSGGDDVIDGGAGDDSLNGGTNTAVGDTVTFEHAGSGVTVNLAITAAQNTIGAGIDSMVGFENLKGSNFNDTLTGNILANVLTGLGGNDTLNGAQGNDTLDGGSGDDTLEGGINDDTLIGGTNGAIGDTATYEHLTGSTGVTVSLTVTGAQNTGNAGVDTLSGIENLKGTIKNDVLTGDGGANTLTGLDGNDVLNGEAGNDTLDGGAGDDTLNGGSDGDTLIGGAGNDTYVVDTGDTVQEVAAEDGTDTIVSELTYTLNTVAAQFIENVTLGGGSAINATGNALNNVLIGNGANNTLLGLDGDDVLEGGDGNDTITGGLGKDTASYVNAGAAVTVSLAIGGGQDTGGAGTDSLAQMENLTGSAFDDVLTGVNNTNVLVGLAGNDILNGGGGADTLDGGDGNDQLDGGAGNDAMTGGAGNDLYIADSGGDVVNETAAAGGLDTVEASATFSLNKSNSTQVENLTLTGAGNINGTGNNVANMLLGNSGNNTLSGLGGDDIVEGFDGNDTLIGGLNGAVGDTVTYEHATAGVTVTLAVNTAQNTVGAGIDAVAQFENLTGSAHNDTLTGGKTANVLSGLAGNDTLNGGAGNDIMYGGAGDDLYIIDSVSDTAIETAPEDGTDTVQSKVTFSLDTADAQYIENIVLTGTANIGATGNALANEILGNSGANTLQGLDGDDIITGGGGRDIMTGGAGEDTFVFSAMTDSGITNATRDQIVDFLAGTDKIDLSAIDAITGGSDDAFSFIGTAAFGGTAGELRQAASGGNTIVSGDVDGNGVGDFQVLLTGSHALNQTDFII